MKPLQLASALAMIACSNSVAVPGDVDCAVIADYAEVVMKARQENVDMADVMKVATDPSGEVEPWKRALIVQAYGSPRFETEPAKSDAMRDFRNAGYLACSEGRAQ